MEQALQKLMQAMPPLENPRYSKVNWKRLEERMGLRYPESFKEFVAVYGATIWFGSWHPFYCPAQSENELDDFMETMSYHLSPLRELGMFKWVQYEEKLSLPLYHEKGGLLPFLIDFDNNCLYSWRTRNPDADKWPVICWVDRQITELRGITIAGMFLEWLHRSDRMRKVWGDVQDVEPDEISLYRG